MQPTEHELTVAVTAAARHAYDLNPQPHLAERRAMTFAELHPVVANTYREAVLGPVQAALWALPDRAALTVARVAGLHHPMHRTIHGDRAEGFGPDAVCAHDALTWPCATAVAVGLPEA